MVLSLFEVRIVGFGLLYVDWSLMVMHVWSGMNGTTLGSDPTNSASRHLYRKSADTLVGRDRGVEESKGTEDGCSVLVSQLESRLDRGSACSLMSTSKHGLSMGEPSLPFSLNFSPKPQRPVVSISRTSTGVLSS